MKFPIMDFFSKCDQIRRKLRIWSPGEILNGKLHFLCSDTHNIFTPDPPKKIIRSNSNSSF